MLETNRTAKQWGMFCHLAYFSGYLIPLGWILGPLVVWLLKREEFTFVDDQGREALNFQVNLLIAELIAFALCFVLIGFVLLPLVALGGIVLTIVGTVEASKGNYYRYPCVLVRLF